MYILRQRIVLIKKISSVSYSNGVRGQWQKENHTVRVKGTVNGETS
nr:MAG TPA: hypothetical protein [Caudoviricetes sp.]